MWVRVIGMVVWVIIGMIPTIPIIGIIVRIWVPMIIRVVMGLMAPIIRSIVKTPSPITITGLPIIIDNINSAAGKIGIIPITIYIIGAVIVKTAMGLTKTTNTGGIVIIIIINIIIANDNRSCAWQIIFYINLFLRRNRVASIDIDGIATVE